MPVFGFSEFPCAAVEDEVVADVDAQHAANHRTEGLFHASSLHASACTIQAQGYPAVAYFKTSAIRLVTCSAWAAMPWALKCTPSADQYSAWSFTKL